MDDQGTTQAITDDQELAKALAGVSKQADDAAESGAGTTFDAADTEATDDTAETKPAEETADTDAAPAADEATEEPTVEAPATEEPEETPTISSHFGDSVSPVTSADSGDLDSIKQEALGELRPLVDKLNVPPEEKFDTYLLLLRSTDDKELIAPAHDAAREIPDEARRAQALLDIIKEIDFLSQTHPA